MQARTFWRGIAFLGLSCGVHSLGVTEAVAQAKRTPYQQIRQSYRDRPTVSPYMSLLGNGAGGGLNYYNIVRPRQQAQKAARRLSNQLQTVQSEVQSLQRPRAGAAPALDEVVINTGRMSPTGHPTAFGYFGGYYTGFDPSQPR